jgi:hypothetical protein
MRLTVYYGLNLKLIGSRHWALDDANKKASLRFTAKEAKKVTAIHIEIWSARSSPTYRVGLQEDVNGKPSGMWLTSATFKPSDVDPTGSWYVVPVTPLLLEEGKVYHIVVQYESGTIGTSNYSQLDIFEVEKVRLFPSGIRDDYYSHLRSTDGGASWTSYPAYSQSFLLEFSDGSVYGIPYHESDWFLIYGNYCYQMYLQPTKRMIVNSVDINVGKVGTPSNLTLVLRNETDAVDEVTIDISQESVIPNFFTVIFPKNVVLQSTKIYTLTLKSPNSDASNYYQWSTWATTDFSPYIENSWGGIKNYCRRSTDGGTTWTDLGKIFDLSFRFTVKFNPALNTPNSGL